MRNVVSFCFLFLVLNALAQNQMTVSGVSITSSGGVIVLNNTTLDNTGTIRDSAATWVIMGNADTSNSRFGGDSLTVINNITIDKTSGNGVMPLGGDINVLGNITLTDGQIYLDSNNIELGPNGYIVAEDVDNRIFDLGFGTIFKDTTLNAPTNVNVGNMGAEITSTSNIGAIRVIRGHNRQYRWDSGGYSIMRYYDFQPTNNSSLNATIRFHYLSPEISPFSHSELDVWTKNDTLWDRNSIPYTSSTRDWTSDSGWLLFSGWDSLVRITLGSNTRLFLPVDWLDVNAKWIDAPNSANVTWATASEQNSSYFEIERSYTGSDFEHAGTIPASGYSSETRMYNFDDVKIDVKQLDQTIYYRLKQFDLDGKFTHSEIVPLNYLSNRINVMVYPNPATNKVHLKIAGSKEVFNVSVMDGYGKQLQEKLIHGMTNTTLDFSAYRQGTYYVRFLDKNGAEIEVINVNKID